MLGQRPNLYLEHKNEAKRFCNLTRVGYHQCIYHIFIRCEEIKFSYICSHDMVYSLPFKSPVYWNWVCIQMTKQYQWTLCLSIQFPINGQLEALNNSFRNLSQSRKTLTIYLKLLFREDFVADINQIIPPPGLFFLSLTIFKPSGS